MQKILMVCLGNICRSPVAEGILRHKANQHNLKLIIDSAGTINTHEGENPDKRSQANALKNGVDISTLVSRPFTLNDFDTFDKIFVMDASNYNDVKALARNQNDSKKVEMILNRLNPNSNQAVPDPYFGGEEGFQQVFDLLDAACNKIVEELGK